MRIAMVYLLLCASADVTNGYMPRPPKFGHPLRTLRTLLGMSQAAFGELIGVAGGTIQALENGRLPMSGKIARRVSLATGADYGELIKGVRGKLMNKSGRRYRLADYNAWSRRYMKAPRDLIELFSSMVIPRVRSALMAAAEHGALTKAYCEIAEAVESAAERVEERHK